jgi:hypothetical protein
VLAHERRRILHFGVTAHPSAEWTAQQLRDAFPWDTAPRYFCGIVIASSATTSEKQVNGMGIQEVLAAPRSPWQRAYVERVIGTIRRDYLDRMNVFSEAALYGHIKSFVAYYHESRTHLSLAKVRRRRGLSKDRRRGASSPSRKSAACTTATNVGRRDGANTLYSRAAPRLAAVSLHPP